MQANIIKWVSNLLNRKSNTEKVIFLRSEYEKLSDYKSQYAQNPTFARLEESLNQLYAGFAGYKKPSRITCCYPTDKLAQQILEFDIQDVPFSLISGLEFYDDHWADVEEVNYLLPRILEVIVMKVIAHLNHDEFSSIQWAITSGAFVGNRLNPLSKWHKSKRDVNEQEAIMNFIYAFIDFVLHNTKAVYEILEALSSTFAGLHLQTDGRIVFGFPLDANKIVTMWDQVEPELRKKQFLHYMNEAYTATKEGGAFCLIILAGIDITSWVVSDKHIVEFDLCDDVHISNMILNDAISKNGEK